jgi:hypothetical protein
MILDDNFSFRAARREDAETVFNITQASIGGLARASYSRTQIENWMGERTPASDAHRVWLGVFPENERARRAYEAVGFKAEGVARGSAFFGGNYRDELIMAILRTEWTPARASEVSEIASFSP